jgi:C4-dicarboxylate-specific signal transduction histidine kinase
MKLAVEPPTCKECGMQGVFCKCVAALKQNEVLWRATKSEERVVTLEELKAETLRVYDERNHLRQVNKHLQKEVTEDKKTIAALRQMNHDLTATVNELADKRLVDDWQSLERAFDFIRRNRIRVEW